MTTPAGDVIALTLAFVETIRALVFECPERAQVSNLFIQVYARMRMQ